jgi:uncharacterized protein
LLPYLAWAWSVDRWDEKWSEATKRSVVKSSRYVHKHKGTIGAIRRVVEPLGYLIKVIEWWKTNETPGTFRLDVGVLDTGITEEMYQEATFTVDEIEHSGAPDKLTIRARSADFRETLNIRRDQSYHQTTLGEMIKLIAERNKLTPALNKAMSDLTVEHIDQTNESDGNLITRLAKQYGAIAAVKNGNLLFIRQGQAKTASGKPIPVMTIIRSLGDGHQFSLTDRGAYTGVVANWLNTRTTEKPVVKVKRKRRRKAASTEKPKEPEEKQGEYLIGTDENVLTLRTTYASKHNAQRAAKSNWERLQRGAAKFSIQLARGRADLYPEVPVKVTGFKKQIDEAEWTLVTVTHSVSDSGFTTALELEVKIDDLDME